MKTATYVITIKPESAFGTPLQGDTLFGQFCWQIAEDPYLAGEGLDSLLEAYARDPFIVFSSAWPVFMEGDRWRFALPRPQLPAHILGDPKGIDSCEERLKRRKETRSRKWLVVGEDLLARLDWDDLISDEALAAKMAEALLQEERRILGVRASRPLMMVEQQHNTINRLTGTTGSGVFTPYPVNNIWFMPGMELALFVAFNPDKINLDQIERGLSRMGQCGFGRDASTGLGRFVIGDMEEIEWPDMDRAGHLLSLGPSVPEKGRFQHIFFQPFTRFGRHGAQLLHTGRPFKAPVVMAGEGAVFVPKDMAASNGRPFVGRAVSGISKAQAGAVMQGYSLVIPLEIPDRVEAS